MPRHVVVPVVLDAADHCILGQRRDIDVRLPWLRVLEERMLFEIAPTLGKSSMFCSAEVLIPKEEDFPFEESAAKFRNHGIRQVPTESNAGDFRSDRRRDRLDRKVFVRRRNYGLGIPASDKWTIGSKRIGGDRRSLPQAKG